MDVFDGMRNGRKRGGRTEGEGRETVGSSVVKGEERRDQIRGRSDV